jgi:hypothetical protein
MKTAFEQSQKSYGSLRQVITNKTLLTDKLMMSA